MAHPTQRPERSLAALYCRRPRDVAAVPYKPLDEPAIREAAPRRYEHTIDNAAFPITASAAGSAAPSPNAACTPDESTKKSGVRVQLDSGDRAA